MACNKKVIINVAKAQIFAGKFKCEDILILRIPFIQMDVTFQFKKLQIPISLAFTICINKAYGHSLEFCSLDRETDCFAHEQLYVSFSRTGKPNNL